MPDVSIAISAQDKYSSALNTMAKITKSFSKDMDEMEDTLGRLNKNKYTLKMDLKDAQRQLEKAEKQFQKTGKAKDELAPSLSCLRARNSARLFQQAETRDPARGPASLFSVTAPPRRHRPRGPAPPQPRPPHRRRPGIGPGSA